MQTWGNAINHTNDLSTLTATDYSNAVQAHMDAVARQKGYDTIASAISYRGDPNPAYDADADAMFIWRSEIWTYANEELRKVLAQERAQPTIGEFLAELPGFSWA